MPARWSVVTTVKFLHAYKSHECLWNTNCDLYLLREARKAAIADLAFQMGMSGLDNDAIKAKIRLMRSKYHNERKKILSAAAVGEKYVPTSYWFEIMDSFLKDVVDMPQPEIITADSVNSSSIYERRLGDDEDSVEKPSQDFKMRSTSEIMSPSSKGAVPIRRGYRPGPACSKRRKKPNTTTVRQDYTEDEFETFGKSVSAQLRKLSLSRALRVQTRIQEFLTEERINDLGIISNSPTLPLSAPPEPTVPTCESRINDLGIISNSPTLPLSTPPEPTVPTSESSVSMYNPALYAGLPDMSSSDMKGTNADSGFDSVDSTTTKSISESTEGLDATIKTESIESEPIVKIEENIPTSPMEDADSPFLQKQMAELKAPEAVTPKEEVIHNVECELVTLDEDDPLKGTGD
ncbi:uncharacterized protein [Palaemon carinicauda]|uniref:uncharacterized protein isoform X2 n=1 Tax=Palaemon carinicauda TaxID=392227 RepID=UPI0035B5E856